MKLKRSTRSVCRLSPRSRDIESFVLCSLFFPPFRHLIASKNAVCDSSFVRRALSGAFAYFRPLVHLRTSVDRGHRPLSSSRFQPQLARSIQAGGGSGDFPYPGHIPEAKEDGPIGPCGSLPAATPGRGWPALWRQPATPHQSARRHATVSVAVSSSVMETCSSGQWAQPMSPAPYITQGMPARRTKKRMSAP